MLDSAVPAMNCHLLIPGLFVPEDAGAGAESAQRLPALEKLLARGEFRKLPGMSLERWLAAAFRIAPQRDLPLAALSLRGDGVDPGDACWLRADPVHLRVRGDRVLLADTSSFDVTTAEAAGLVAALNAHFARDGLEFTAPTPRRWYLRLREEPRIRTSPTAEVAGRDIGDWLPQGEDGSRWRRILNEAQMLLHAQPDNEAREARGALPVNGVWFWGAGCLPEVPRDGPYGAIWSTDPVAAGIALSASLPLHALPLSGELWLQHRPDCAGGRSHLLVVGELEDIRRRDPSAWRSALAEFDRGWIAPLLDALARGKLQSLTLHGPGPDRSCTATMTRLDTLKFWRMRRRWQYYLAT